MTKRGGGRGWEMDELAAPNGIDFAFGAPAMNSRMGWLTATTAV